MRTESITLTVDGGEYPGELTLPDEETDTGAVLLPGANHGPYGDVFDRLAEALTDAGIALVRFEAWGDRDDVPDIAETNPEDIFAAFDAAVERLRADDFDRVGAVAKSFGGHMVLRHRPDGIDELVLWAPAVFLAGGHAVDTVEIPDEAPDDVDLPTIDGSLLSDHDHPVTILQGDEDFYTPESARELAAELPDATVRVLAGGDHSFVGGDPEDETVETTVARLSGDER